MPRRIARYGWKPSLPDQRDDHFTVPFPVLRSLPPSVNLTPQNAPIYDQGNLGSCTANALSGVLEFDQIKQQLRSYIPGRLFIYYNTRSLEGTESIDAGASLRDTCKAITRWGYPDELVWAYDIKKFATRPPDDVYRASAPNKKISYQRVYQSLQQMKGVLASGYVFTFGIAVYESFESPIVEQTGIVPLPAPAESMIGGHALVCVGYIDSAQRFLFRNSWGSSWGSNGYGTIPYSYLMNPYLSGDMWVVTHVVG